MYALNDPQTLAERVGQLASKSSKRVVIGIAGIPGSGKTTLTAKMCELMNQKGFKTQGISQDGFHYYRQQLYLMKNSREAIERRGAPFTFDAVKFLRLVEKFNDPQYKDTEIMAPSFDHSKKDPIENDVVILPDTKIIFVEGNYLALKDPVWKELGGYFDEIWRLEVLMEEAKERLVERHLTAGICATREEAQRRAEDNDLVNGVYILENLVPATISIS